MAFRIDGSTSEPTRRRPTFKFIARFDVGLIAYVRSTPAESKGLDGVDLAAHFEGELFNVSSEQAALPGREFVQQVSSWVISHPGKREANRVGHSATHVDQVSHMPRIVLLPGGMMPGDDGFEIGGQFPLAMRCCPASQWSNPNSSRSLERRLLADPLYVVNRAAYSCGG